VSKPAPAGAQCAAHPESDATWVCGRCGTFFCALCERRVRPEALPMCPTCWELRQKVAPKPPNTKATIQTVGLVLGVFSLIPGCFALQVASIIVNIIAIVRAKEPFARSVRWRAILGLLLSCVGLVLGGVLLIRQ